MASKRRGFEEGSGAQLAWVDANVRHQIGLMRVAGSISRETLELLDMTETDIRHQIKDRLRRAKRRGTPADVERLRGLLKEVREIRYGSWRKVRKLWLDRVGEVTRTESRTMKAILQTISPTSLDPKPLLLSDADRIVRQVPFEGHLLREWADSIAATDVSRINGQIKVGMVQGEGISEIARRVVGSASLRGRDGVTQVTRQQAEGIVRTAVNHTTNQARREWFEENEEFFDIEMFLATLDSRTTKICASLDGERFPIGEGRIPPIHFGCRSQRVALLDPEPIGNRPMNPTTKKQLLRDYAKENGLEKIPRHRDDLPKGHKGAFDKFARTRVREMIGQVPTKVRYSTFLKRQPKWFQEDYLGKTKAKLFREGMTLDQFTLSDGTELTLSDLAKNHAKTFRKAGLDPAAFAEAK